MKSTKLILFGMILGVLTLVGCQKLQDVWIAHHVPAVPADSTTVTGPTTELEKMGAVKVVSPKDSATEELVAIHDAVQRSMKVSVASKSLTARIPNAKSKRGSPAKLHTIPDAEKAATEKAQANAVRADCLRRVVEYKLDKDVALGEMRELGNVLEASVCR